MVMAPLLVVCCLGKDLEFMRTRKVWKWHALLGGNSNPFRCFFINAGNENTRTSYGAPLRERMESGGIIFRNIPAIGHVNYQWARHRILIILLPLQKNKCAMQVHLMSYELKGGIDAGRRFIDALQMCVRAVSLGTAGHTGIASRNDESFWIEAVKNASSSASRMD
jgi:methionine-gamma-lyase